MHLRNPIREIFMGPVAIRGVTCFRKTKTDNTTNTDIINKSKEYVTDRMKIITKNELKEISIYEYMRAWLFIYMYIYIPARCWRCQLSYIIRHLLQHYSRYITRTEYFARGSGIKKIAIPSVSNFFKAIIIADKLFMAATIA